MSLIGKDLTNEITINYRYFYARYSLRDSPKRRDYLRRDNSIHTYLTLIFSYRRGYRDTIEGI
jgi:hypothetical protein